MGPGGTLILYTPKRDDINGLQTALSHTNSKKCWLSTKPSIINWIKIIFTQYIIILEKVLFLRNLQN